MIDFLDFLYASTRNTNTLLKKIRFDSLMRLFIRCFANIVLPVFFKLTESNVSYQLSRNSNKGNGRVIVSVTSFPARINRLWLTLETILRQTSKPDMIIVWLSKEQFSSLSVLPEKLLKMQKRGVKIELRDGDIRSYKKFYYILKEYSNVDFITIDDDIFYPSNMIESLISNHKTYPDSIIGRYIHQIVYSNNNIASYKDWKQIDKKSINSYNCFFGSGGGVYFPCGSLPMESLNQSVFMSICASADDVWLNSMCRLNNCNIVPIIYNCSILPVLNWNNLTLSSINLTNDLNDKQLSAVRDYLKNKYSVDPYEKLFNY